MFRFAWEDGCITLARRSPSEITEYINEEPLKKENKIERKREKKGVVGFINMVNGTDSLLQCI